MFQPENEDMLPRCAPKPSVPLDMNTAAIVRPIVPEVSILFGAQQAESPNATTSTIINSEKPHQTYAAWKKQVLPKVSFPPAGAEVYSINGHVVSSAGVSDATTATLSVSSASAPANTRATTNLYPLRPVTANATPMHTGTSSNAVACVNGVTTQMQQYRRSLEVPSRSQDNMQRRSLDGCTAMARSCNPNLDVLTICAGTQTDATEFSDVTNCDSALLARLATKEDFQQLLAVLGELRMEQLRLMNAMESLLDQQQSSAPQQTVARQNTSTQYNDSDCFEPKKNPTQLPRRQYEVIEEYNIIPGSTASNACYQPINELPAYRLESPRQPAAQSTAYQAATPCKTTPSTANAIPNKPSTEKSMMMNELALKYLPSEQLNELLKELNIAPMAPQQTNTPLRPIETMEKRPSDISNASYKYLKKYRLLPEERHEVKEQIPVRSPLAQVVQQHQQQQQEQSPYQQPKAMARVITMQSPMLDLEHIRRQPKLI